jgi:hypothetical protein
LEKSHVELRSLKQSITESALKSYFPSRDMSFHDKVVFAIHDLESLLQKHQPNKVKEL